jgi:hypothetical protein
MWLARIVTADRTNSRASKALAKPVFQQLRGFEPEKQEQCDPNKTYHQAEDDQHPIAFNQPQ